MRHAFWVLTMTTVLLATLLLAVPAEGSSCRAVVANKVVVEKQVVVKEVAAVVTPVVAAYVPIIAATYAGVYAPPAAYSYPGHSYPNGQQQPQYQSPLQQRQPDDGLAEAIRQLTSEVRGLKDRVNRMEGIPPSPQSQPQQSPPMPPADPQQSRIPQEIPRFVQLMSTHCAACHESRTAASRGKGLVLLEGGNLKIPSAEILGTVVSEVTSKRMPRGGNMTDAERLELIAGLVGGNKQ